MAQTSFFMLSLLTYGLMPQLSDPKISSTLILMLHKILELKARHNMYILFWVLHYFSDIRSRAQYSSFTSRCLIGTFHRMLMVQGAISVVLEYIQKYGLTMYIYSKYVGTVPFFKKWPESVYCIVDYHFHFLKEILFSYLELCHDKCPLMRLDLRRVSHRSSPAWTHKVYHFFPQISPIKHHQEPRTCQHEQSKWNDNHH